MRIVFGPEVPGDLRWFQRYFAGATDDAIERYFKILELLSSSPSMGRPIPGEDAREYAIPRMPFSLIYRVREDSIEILRVWDQRADRSTLWKGRD